MSDLFFRSEDPRPTIFAANAMFWLAAAGLIIAGFFAEILVLFFARFMPGLSVSMQILLATLAYYIPFGVLPVLLYARLRGAAKTMRLLEPIAPGAAALALAAAILAVPLGLNVSALWQALLEGIGLHLPSASAHTVPTTREGLMMSVIYLGMLPGVCEELVFRGMILSAWERRGARRALIISSVLFALLHGSIAGFPVQLLMGLILGVIALGSGSIYGCMIFHTLYNSLTLMLQYAINLIPYTEEELAAAANATVLEALGGAAGLVGAVIAVLIQAGLMLLILRQILKRRQSRLMPAEDGLHARMSIYELLLMVSALVTVVYLFVADMGVF